MQSSYDSLKSERQSGNIIVVIILVVLLVASLGFGFWAYAGMVDNKNNVDKKVTTASEIVKQQTATEKDKEYAEKDKSPYRKYSGPNTYGAVSFQYPKTWSAYISEGSTDQSDPINGYLNPDVVPGVESGAAYALRFKVVGQSYDEVLKEFGGDADGTALNVSPFRAKNVSNLLGSRLVGTISDNPKKVNMVVLPIRDKTLEIWTESDQFVADFNNIILPTLTFSP